MTSLIFCPRRFGAIALAVLYASPSLADEPMPDPRALLKGVERERTAITSGIVESDVTFNAGPGILEPRRVHLVVAFDGDRFRFDEDSPWLMIDWIHETGSSLEKRSRLFSLWGGPEAVVRDGLGYREVGHVRTIHDGTKLLRYSKNHTTTISDPRRGTGGSVAFDPRVLGLSTFQSLVGTLEKILAPRAGEGVRLVGREAVGGVSSWHVVIDGGATGLERHFWIESPPGYRVYKVESRSRSGRTVIDSEYDPSEKGDAGRLPTRVRYVMSDARGKVIMDDLLERSREPGGSEFGKSLEPESWTLAGLGMPIGEPIYDFDRKRVIGYWDGKALSETPLPRPAEDHDEPPLPPLAKLLEVARRDPGGPLALDALGAIAYRSPSSVEATESLALLAEQHARTPGAGEVALAFSRLQPESAERPLRSILEESPNAEDRARAGYGLATVLIEKSERLGAGGAGEAAVAEAEGLLERVISSKLDVEVRPFGSLAGIAPILLKELRCSSVGKLVPDLSGTDLGGMPLSLGAYRGKVVVLSVWSTGCAPCIRMIPRERELVTRMKGRPFALLGVNRDEDRAMAVATSAREAMTWPSLWVGQDGGPLVERWGAPALPSIFVIDARGMIRFKNPTGDALERIVESLVVEAESR